MVTVTIIVLILLKFIVIKGATLRFVHLEKFSLNFSSLFTMVCCLQSVSIFAILNHPRSYLVYSSQFDVFLSYKLIFCGFLHVEGNFARRRKRRDVAPLSADIYHLQ